MAENIEILEKTVRYKGFFEIVSYRFRHEVFAGGWSDEIHREVFERGQAVGVLLYDPLADTVVLLEQFRIGAFAAAMEPWQIEVVAGIIEEGEALEDVARREAIEEAGATIGELVPICRYLVSPGGASESVTLFCGRVDTRGLGGLHGLPHEHEDIKVDVVPAETAIAAVTEGRVGNAITIISLQWLALNRERLRKRWL